MSDCGIVGILAKDNGNVYEKLVHSLHVLQHRGEDACGILIHNNGESQLERRLGLVSTGFHFTPESIMDGDRGIGHTRYPTTNLNSDLPACDIQPIEIIYPWIKLYIAHNGTITSFCGLPLYQTESDQQPEDEVIQEEEVCDSELTQANALQLLQKVKPEMVGGTDTETVGRILAHLAQHCTLEEALKKVIPELAGSFAFLIQTADKVIGIRDPHGIRPLCFGELPDGGIPFGVGLSRSTGIPLMSHGLIRDKYTGRTFIRGQETYGLDRSALVMRKVSFLHDVIEDRIVILADDSIVRGTTTRCLSEMAIAAGAKDVIYCFNFPPVRYICPLGIEMFKGGREQFIANRVIGASNLQELEMGIAKILGVKAAYYTDPRVYLEELGLKPDEACLGCTEGIYPFEEQNQLYGSMENEVIPDCSYIYAGSTAG